MPAAHSRTLEAVSDPPVAAASLSRGEIVWVAPKAPDDESDAAVGVPTTVGV